MDNLLIAIEGLDGSGKSTMAKYLIEQLKNIGKKVEFVATREKKLENIFIAVNENFELDPNSEAYMFYFQFLHANKVDRAIKALKEGKFVIADRWDLSFFAWHENIGFFRNEEPELRKGISRLAFRDLEPDLGIYLDLPVETALNRIQIDRGDVIPDLETEKRRYQIGLKAYRQLAMENGWITIDASNELEKVKEITWELVNNKIQKAAN